MGESRRERRDRTEKVTVAVPFQGSFPGMCFPREALTYNHEQVFILLCPESGRARGISIPGAVA